MSGSNTAVIYQIDDHIGTPRRLMIDAVDTAIAVILSVIPTIAAFVLLRDETAALVMLSSWVVVWTLYFVVLKGSRFRTFGYVLAGARIVNMKGGRPGYVPLLGRLAFAVLGPFNFLADLLWVSSDPRRQALRDKFAHTYVIRKDAVPVGMGRIVYCVYMVFGMTLLFAEVREVSFNGPDGESAPHPPAAPSPHRDEPAVGRRLPIDDSRDLLVSREVRE